MTCLKLFTFNKTSKKIKKKIYFFCDAKCYEMLSRNIYPLICLHQKHVANSQLLNPSISIILAKYIEHNEKVLKVTFRILQRSDGIADLHDSVFSMSRLQEKGKRKRIRRTDLLFVQRKKRIIFSCLILQEPFLKAIFDLISNESHMGSRSTFEFPSWVNLSGPSLYCTWLYGQEQAVQ